MLYAGRGGQCNPLVSLASILTVFCSLFVNLSDVGRGRQWASTSFPLILRLSKDGAARFITIAVASIAATLSCDPAAELLRLLRYLTVTLRLLLLEELDEYELKDVLDSVVTGGRALDIWRLKAFSSAFSIKVVNLALA